MKGTLFTLFDVSAPAYFILLLTGFLFATAVGALWARRIGEDPDVIVDLGLACLLAGVVGGRILSVLADGYFWDFVHLCTDPMKVGREMDRARCVSPEYQGVWDAAKQRCFSPVRDCLQWAQFWNGGLAYYGGFLGASGAAYYLLKRDRFPFWRAADMAGFAVPLGLGFGRMGCLLAGCCFGLPTASPVGMAFPGGSPASQAQFKLGELASARAVSHPVHPTQIYEALASLLIAAFCYAYVHPKKRYDGQVFVVFVALYALARFALEFLRADDRGALFGLSTSQLIGLALVAAAYALHRRLSARAGARSSTAAA